MKAVITLAVFLGLLLSAALPAQAETVSCVCEQAGTSCNSDFYSSGILVCQQADAHKDLDGCRPLGVGELRGGIQCLGQGVIQVDDWSDEDQDPAVRSDAPEATAEQTQEQTRPTSAVGTGRGVLLNPLAGRTVSGLLGQVVAWLGTAAGALFFLYLLWGGVQWMTAGGDQQQAANARKRIVAAVAGIAVILFAYILVATIIGIVPQ